MSEGLGVLLLLGFLFLFYIYLPVVMAQDRNRSAVVWVLVSLLVSPIVAILLLVLMGKVEE